MDDDATGSAGEPGEPEQPPPGKTAEAAAGTAADAADPGLQDATGPRSATFSRQTSGPDAGGLRRASEPSEPVSRDDTPPFGRRRRGRFAIGGVAVLVVGALVAALFVLPVRAWLGQRRALARGAP